MKKGINLLVVVIGVLSLSSCAIHNGYMNNSASLSQANFSYIQTSISGKASTLNVLGIGGLDRSAIVEEAKRDMLNKHPLKKNQALVNTTVNWKSVYYLIVITNECTVTADVVEFYSEGEERKTEIIKNTPENIDKVNDESRFKIGDKVQYKDAFKRITGVIVKRESNFYYIKYKNKKGVEQTLKSTQSWLKKIE